MGQDQASFGQLEIIVVEQVEIDVARSIALPFGGTSHYLFNFLGTSEEFERGEPGLQFNHGIVELTGTRRAIDRLRFVDRRDEKVAGSADTLGGTKRRKCLAEMGQAVSEIRTEADSNQRHVRKAYLSPRTSCMSNRPLFNPSL